MHRGRCGGTFKWWCKLKKKNISQIDIDPNNPEPSYVFKCETWHPRSTLRCGKNRPRAVYRARKWHRRPCCGGRPRLALKAYAWACAHMAPPISIAARNISGCTSLNRRNRHSRRSGGSWYVARLFFFSVCTSSVQFLFGEQRTRRISSGQSSEVARGSRTCGTRRQLTDGNTHAIWNANNLWPDPANLTWFRRSSRSEKMAKH